MKRLIIVSAALLSVIECSLGKLQAQAPQPPPQRPHSLVAANEQAKVLRSGNRDAAVYLVHQGFQNIGVTPDIIDSLGLTNSIANTEVDYRHNQHSPAIEADVVRAVNNFVGAIGAPRWALTDGQEVRKVRMHLVVLYPDLMASQGKADAEGHFKAFDEAMSPVESTYVALTLLYQKMHNAEYQFSAQEQQNLDSRSLADEHVARRVELRNRVNSLTALDLISASDHLFSDLGIPVSSSSIVYHSAHLLSDLQKGAR